MQVKLWNVPIFTPPQDFTVKKVVYIAGKEKSNRNPWNVKTYNVVIARLAR
jgi:hypothetical protein